MNVMKKTKRTVIKLTIIAFAMYVLSVIGATWLSVNLIG